jgi:hypothetical protein
LDGEQIDKILKGEKLSPKKGKTPAEEKKKKPKRSVKPKTFSKTDTKA